MAFGGFFILLIGLGILGALVGSNNTTPSNVAGVNEAKPTTDQTTSQPVEKSSETIPAEYRSALNQANTYANNMNLSKKAVYDQLVSDYGGKFTAPAAQYAIDNVKADWNANALAQAKTYQNNMSLSPAAVRDQLVSDYGGKFTPEEADYAVANLNK